MEGDGQRAGRGRRDRIVTDARCFHVMLPHAEGAKQKPFLSVVKTLVWGLQEIGFSATSAIGDWRNDATNIVLCPHLLDAGTLASLAPDTILYNLEQITPASPIPPSRLWELRHWRIWDFSARNQAIWNSLGIEAAIVPIGWHPGLERIRRNDEPDIDVLFYGIVNPRRKALLDRLADRGLRLSVGKGVFGAELDSLIARSKVVLNVHFYPTHLLETLRLSYLLGNGCAVVSERSPRTEIPQVYEQAIHWAAYEDLIDACCLVVDDVERRSALGAAGRAAMRQLAIAPLLSAALGLDRAKSAAP